MRGVARNCEFLATPHVPVQAANVFPRDSNALITQITQQEKPQNAPLSGQNTTAGGLFLCAVVVRV